MKRFPQWVIHFLNQCLIQQWNTNQIKTSALWSIFQPLIETTKETGNFLALSIEPDSDSRLTDTAAATDSDSIEWDFFLYLPIPLLIMKPDQRTEPHPRMGCFTPLKILPFWLLEWLMRMLPQFHTYSIPVELASVSILRRVFLHSKA